MKSVAIFGGTFDPVHLGHEHILRAANEAVNLEKIFVIPTKMPPHKKVLNLCPDEHRLEMCRIAFADVKNAEVSDFEIKSGGKSYSYYTVKHFKQLYPEHTLYFIMGSDMLLSFHEWYRYEDILDMAEIISISRADDVSQNIMTDYAAKLTEKKGTVITLDLPPFEISSTDIRQKLKNHEDCSCYLDKNVVQYISDNKLYL